MGDEGLRWVQVSHKAFFPCCSLLQLSIFNLSRTLPIGLSATRRCLIGRSARRAIQALFSSLSSTTVLQCSEDCSSPVVETFYKSNRSFPLNPHTDTDWRRELYHTPGAVLQTRQQLERSPRTFSSVYVHGIHFAHTHSLSPSVSLPLSCWHCTQSTYTHSNVKKTKMTCSLLCVLAWRYVARSQDGLNDGVRPRGQHTHSDITLVSIYREIINRRRLKTATELKLCHILLVA